MSLKKTVLAYKISQILRYFIVIMIFIFTFIQILVLSPSSLNKPTALEDRTMIDRREILWDLNHTRQKVFEDKPPLAQGIPSNQIPQYRLKKLSYISNHQGKKEWRLKALEGRQFHDNGITHALLIEAELFSDNPDEKPTLITGLEARYETENRKLEVYGNVVAVFPDGFTVKSEYMLYVPQEKLIYIPEQYEVHGLGITSDSKEFRFASLGMRYPMESKKINLLKKVTTEILPKKESKDESSTQIHSDVALIDRAENTVYYTMQDPQKTFVKLIQPTMEVTSRRMRLNYSNENKSLEKLYAFDEALILEFDEKHVLTRRATCNEAQFDYNKNLMHLIGYPQVYQNQDTITGQLIIINRTNDTVRVERSNAFNKGS